MYIIITTVKAASICCHIQAHLASWIFNNESECGEEGQKHTVGEEINNIAIQPKLLPFVVEQASNQRMSQQI